MRHTTASSQHVQRSRRLSWKYLRSITASFLVVFSPDLDVSNDGEDGWLSLTQIEGISRVAI